MIGVDLPVVILAEEVRLEGELLNVVFWTEKVIVLVAMLGNIKIDKLQGLGIGSERFLRECEQGFFIKGKE